MEKGHYGQYTGNARHSRTPVTRGNYKASERDDAAHIDYLKRDIKYDAKHGGSDKQMTSDEKHISKLAGDMKYDKKHHSPLNNTGTPIVDEFGNPVPADFQADFVPRDLTPGVTSDINAMRSYDPNVANPAIDRFNNASYTQGQIDSHNEIYKEAGLVSGFRRRPDQRTKNPKYKK